MSNEKRRSYSRFNILGGISLISAIIILVLYSIILNWEIHCPDPDQLITISKGASATSVASSLKEKDCLKNESIFMAPHGAHILRGFVVVGVV